MDKTLTIGIVVATLLLAGAFFAGRATVQCPEVDQSTIDLLNWQVAEKDMVIDSLARESSKAIRRADSLAQIQPRDVDQVLPTIPRGRTSAELDSIGAIILDRW